MTMPDDAEQEMFRTLVDLGQYLGHAIKTHPDLPNNSWTWDSGGSVVLAHNIWESLQVPFLDAEMILPDEEFYSQEWTTRDEH